MKPKAKTIGQRIEAIRGEMYQVDFGKLLGVSQGAVSAWERDDKARAPSAEIYFRLAMLASHPEDSIFFLQQAHLSPEVILSAAAKIRADRNAPLLEGEIIRVPRIRHMPQSGEEESPLLALPSLAVPNPDLVGYFVIDGPGQMGDIQRGDIVVLDTSADITRSLGDLWDNLVLFKLFRPAGIPDQDWELASERDNGFYLGTLRCKADVHFKGDRAGLKDWVVALELFPTREVIFDNPPAIDRCVGEMRLTPKDWKSIGAPKSTEDLATKQAEVRRMGYRFFEGVAILGRVLFWFTPVRGHEII